MFLSSQLSQFQETLDFPGAIQIPKISWPRDSRLFQLQQCRSELKFIFAKTKIFLFYTGMLGTRLSLLRSAIYRTPRIRCNAKHIYENHAHVSMKILKHNDFLKVQHNSLTVENVIYSRPNNLHYHGAWRYIPYTARARNYCSCNLAKSRN